MQSLDVDPDPLPCVRDFAEGYFSLCHAVLIIISLITLFAYKSYGARPAVISFACRKSLVIGRADLVDEPQCKMVAVVGPQIVAWGKFVKSTLRCRF